MSAEGIRLTRPGARRGVLELVLARDVVWRQAGVEALPGASEGRLGSCSDGAGPCPQAGIASGGLMAQSQAASNSSQTANHRTRAAINKGTDGDAHRSPDNSLMLNCRSDNVCIRTCRRFACAIRAGYALTVAPL